MSTLLEINKIVADPNQPRKYFSPHDLKRLKDSVRRFGILTPVTVEQVSKEGKYLLVDGERRFRVAQELKITKIPAVILQAESYLDRTLKQFHIQEQRAGWTAAEKAKVVMDLAKELKIPVAKMCELLAIPETTAKRYLAIGQLMDPSILERSELPIDWALPINRLNKTVANTLQDTDINFTKLDQKKLEKAVVRRAVNEGLESPDKTCSRIRDIVKTNPNYLDKVINGTKSLEELFEEVGGRAQQVWRNLIVQSRYLTGYARKAKQYNDVPPPSKRDTAYIKDAKEALESILSIIDA